MLVYISISAGIKVYLVYSRWKMLVRLSCLPRGTWQAYRWLRFSPSQWSGYHRLPGLDLGLQSYLRRTVVTVLLYFFNNVSYHSASLQGARYRHSSMLELQFWWSAMEL